MDSTARNVLFLSRPRFAAAMDAVLERARKWFAFPCLLPFSTLPCESSFSLFHFPIPFLNPFAYFFPVLPLPSVYRTASTGDTFAAIRPGFAVLITTVTKVKTALPAKINGLAEV